MLPCWQGLSWRASKRKILLTEKPCVRIHQHPTCLYAEHFLYSPCTSNQKVWKHCRPAIYVRGVPASFTTHKTSFKDLNEHFIWLQVKHVWAYRMSPTHLSLSTYICIWPKFWLSAAGLDQWFMIKFPLLMINIRTERVSTSFNPWLKVTSLKVIALKWVKKNKKHSIANIHNHSFLLEANLFRSRREFFSSNILDRKRLWFPTDVKLGVL